VSTPARLGKYEITEVLGTGAMGVVYKGFDPGIRRIVAIKTIRRELITGDRPATAMLARFRNEARAAGRLSHPGIVAVHDYGEDAEVAYIAMEYVEGNSLREYFARGVKFSERDAISIVSQLLEALAHAHERRVWHRDIKPANLIVMTNGRVKVADFGIARIEASDLTLTGAVMGTPGYMAPEQYAAAAIDHRADVFAAGVVFYQLLTGSRPFIGTTEQIAYAICHTEAARPSVVDPGKGWERYDALVAKALAKRRGPSPRPPSPSVRHCSTHARPAAASSRRDDHHRDPAGRRSPGADRPSRPRARRRGLGPPLGVEDGSRAIAAAPAVR
jgi:serine/threonine-protein kinase